MLNLKAFCDPDTSSEAGFEYAHEVSCCNDGEIPECTHDPTLIDAGLSMVTYNKRTRRLWYEIQTIHLYQCCSQL